DQAFDRYGIDLKLNLSGPKTVRFGGDNGAEDSFAMPSGGSADILQYDRNNTSTPLHYDIFSNSVVRSSGSRAEGWGDLSDSSRGLLVSSRYFWQKYPKGVSFGDDGSVSFEPAATPKLLYVAMGTGDELLYYFHAGADSPQAHSFTMGLSKSPLLARTTPQQY